MVTEVTVRILRSPETARALLIGFPSSEQAGQCVSDVIGAGIIPGGMEIMDGPAIQAAEDFVHAGYPVDCGALLIVELDGPETEVDYLIARVRELAEKNDAKTIRISTAKRSGRISGPVARRHFGGWPRLSRLLLHGRHDPASSTAACLKTHERNVSTLWIAGCERFHAGDGNLHPLILYDANNPGELEKAEEFGADILKLCVEVGGVLTGEHGVGVEKRDLMGTMFNEGDLKQQQRLKCAFDPESLLNPGKVFPTLHRCAELGGVHIHGGQTRFPDIPRF